MFGTNSILGVDDVVQTDLSWSKLVGVDLSHARLVGVNSREADLRGADLRWADLRGADLEGADLRGADLRGADRRGAPVRGPPDMEDNGTFGRLHTLWDQVQLEWHLLGAPTVFTDARCDETTRWGAYVPLACRPTSP